MLLRPALLSSKILPILSITSCILISSCATITKQQALNTRSDTHHNARIEQSSQNILIHGGSILTMQGMTPYYVEALLVQDGRITFAGDLKQAKQQQQKQQKNSQEIDLKHYTLLPGFIDAHSHLNSVGLQQTVANLYP